MGLRGWGWCGIILGLLVGLGFWLAPYGLSVYHLEAGGRALDAALVPVFSDRLAPEQVVDGERLAAGMAHLEEAVRWDPRDVQALRLLARGYVSLGEREAALETLQRALAVRPENPMLHLELGDVYDSIGDAEAAVREYEAGGIGSRVLPAAANYLKLADGQALFGSGELAISFWRKALALDPGNLYALYQLARIHRDLGDVERAAGYEERLRYFELESIAVPLDFRLAEYQGRAMVGLVEEGIWRRETLLSVISYQVWQFAEDVNGLMTEHVLEVLLGQWPEDPDILFYLAELHQRRGDLEQARDGYLRVLEVDPEYGRAYLRLGMVAEAECESRTTGCEEAAEWYARYYEVAPDDLLGLKRLAEICTALEEAGIEEEGCRKAAERISSSNLPSGITPAAILREALEARTDDRRIVAELLGVPVEDVELGPNLVKNGGFEEWVGGRPEQWGISNMATGDPWNRGAFRGGQDGLIVCEGESSVRINGLWLERRYDREPGRYGFALETPVVLFPGHWYVLSLDYKTEGLPDNGATVWTTDKVPWSIFPHEIGLPSTGGEWNHFVLLRYMEVEGISEIPVWLIVRIWQPGWAWFDNISLMKVQSE